MLLLSPRLWQVQNLAEDNRGCGLVLPVSKVPSRFFSTRKRAVKLCGAGTQAAATPPQLQCRFISPEVLHKVLKPSVLLHFSPTIWRFLCSTRFFSRRDGKHSWLITTTGNQYFGFRVLSEAADCSKALFFEDQQQNLHSAPFRELQLKTTVRGR